MLARKTGKAKSNCFTHPQHPCSLAACKRKGLGSSLSKLGRQQQGGKQNTLLSKTLSPSKIVSPVCTWVLCSDKCDGFVFWLLKRDFLCVLLTSVKLRQSYRDVLRWWFYFHTWQIFGWSTLLFSKLVGIVLNTQSSRLFAEPSPDESSFVLPGPPSDHYCPSSSPSRSGPEILMTNYNWLILNEKAVSYI